MVPFNYCKENLFKCLREICYILQGYALLVMSFLGWIAGSILFIGMLFTLSCLSEACFGALVNSICCHQFAKPEGLKSKIPDAVSKPTLFSWVRLFASVIIAHANNIHLVQLEVLLPCTAMSSLQSFVSSMASALSDSVTYQMRSSVCFS